LSQLLIRTNYIVCGSRKTPNSTDITNMTEKCISILEKCADER